jgi:hypothetical protein
MLVWPKNLGGMVLNDYAEPYFVGKSKKSSPTACIYFLAADPDIHANRARDH